MPRALSELMRVEIADDKMSATLVIEGGGEPGPLDLAGAESLLTSREIPATRERTTRVQELLDRYAAEPAQTHRSLVARGLAPVHGVGARLELVPADGDLSALTNPDATTPHEPSPDRVDHHARTRIHAIHSGQVVGRVHPPKQGSDGVDVFGQVVRARAPRHLPLTIEDSISISPDGTLTANIGGLVEHANHRLRISDTLTIAGEVDFSVGNVEFPGHVVLRKGVRDEFQVHAGGDLRIADLVEAASVQAGRDLTLEIGMSGRGKGSLRAGRDLKAKYLADVKAVVLRDTHVQKDLSNCDLRVGRHLRGPACTLMRGELWVGATCELAHVGTEAHVQTTIILGKFESLEEAARQALRLAPDVLAQHERSHTELSAFRRGVKKPTPAQAEELTLLEFQCAKDESTLRQLERGVRTIAQQMEKCARADLVVHGAIYPGVRVWIGGYCVEIHAAIRGPIRIALDDHGGPFCVDTSINEKHNLAKFARVRADPRFLDLEQEARNLGLCIRPSAQKAA